MENEKQSYDPKIKDALKQLEILKKQNIISEKDFEKIKANVEKMKQSLKKNPGE